MMGISSRDNGGPRKQSRINKHRRKRSEANGKLLPFDDQFFANDDVDFSTENQKEVN